jgi:hypothetical protein
VKICKGLVLFELGSKNIAYIENMCKNEKAKSKKLKYWAGKAWKPSIVVLF